MGKINIAELLKDCPKGMELDCTICSSVKFIELDRNPNFAIVVRANNGYEFALTRYGQVHNIDDAKCVIFPKGKTTWEGFVPPCKFKDGDIISNGRYIAFFYKIDKPKNFVSSNVVYYHCWYNPKYGEFNAEIDYGIETIEGFKYATGEEKQKLFQAIKDNGYHWNAETKTLEKLVESKFKDGDVVVAESDKKVQMFIVKEQISNRSAECYIGYDFYNNNIFKEGTWAFNRLATEKEKQKLFDAIKAKGFQWNTKTKTLEKLPKFKVGDRVRHKTTNTDDIYEISKVYDDSYGLVDYTWMLYMKYQDNYELVPDKFDITTLKPFDKVLVRNTNNGRWCGQFYMSYGGIEGYSFNCTYNCWKQCIPYEGNEHLLGTTDDCDDFYKNWE